MSKQLPSNANLKHHLEAHAVIQTPDGAHAELLLRITNLIAEHTENAAQSLQRMLGEEPKSAAIIAIALGQETTAAILKHLSDTEIQELAQEISNLSVVTTEEEDQHLETFEQLIMAGKYVTQGGIDYARGALEKAVGKRKTQAILKRLNAQHENILNRLKNLVSERPEDIARILTHADTKQAALFAATIGKKEMRVVINNLPKAVAKNITDASQNAQDISIEYKTETLEHIERLVVTLKYVLTGGQQFARGALAKSFGNPKASKMLDQITPSSGFLQLWNLSPKKASALLSDEPPEAIADILSPLDSPQSILIFHHFSANLKKQIASHLEHAKFSESENRQLDQHLAKKIAKAS
jgi:flagellar motor switch protein FliG